MIRSDEDYILATAALMRVLAELQPGRRTEHLAEYAERRAEEIRQRRRLETWPDPGEGGC